jgi:glycosyltransferase involved in cell wall biosynthesis
MSILPNGVDIEYFYPNQAIQKDDLTIIFSGKMSYHANITMVLYLVERVMPYVWHAIPNTKLYIVGKDPSSEIMALSKHPEIVVTGTVKDLRPYLWKATLAVVPLIYGAGSQLKLLEAMACGLPVVATPRAALPLATNPGKDLLLAEDPKEFANAVLNLLTSSSKRDQVASSGLEYVQRNHNWHDISGKLEKIYSETIYRQKRST